MNSYYEDNVFYTVTYDLSQKMRQIRENPQVAVCGEWFTAQGIGKNIGHPRETKNTELMDKLRTVFAEWYENGHTDESDPHTCLLRVRLTEGILFHQGTRYDMDFTAEEKGI